MKRYIFSIFLSLIFVVGLRAQLNEIHLSYHMVNTADLGRGASLSYYRAISPKTAIGIRTNFTRKNIYNDIYSNTGSIDIVHRWNFLKSKKFRILAELGPSALQQYGHSNMVFFRGNSFDPANSFILPAYPTNNKNGLDNTYFGIVAVIGFDLQIGKLLTAGLDLASGYYRRGSSSYFDNVLQPSNLRLRIGSKF